MGCLGVVRRASCVVGRGSCVIIGHALWIVAFQEDSWS